MRRLITLNIAALLVVISMQSCTKANVSQYAVPGTCSDTISFAAKVEPLIMANCATSGCHDAATQQSGYNLTTHSNIAANAPIILSVMRWESGATPMPYQLPQLPDSLIQQFSCWMDQGKLDN
jgi:hypothetical protein